MSLENKIQEFIDKNYIYRFSALSMYSGNLREIIEEYVSQLAIEADSSSGKQIRKLMDDLESRNKELNYLKRHINKIITISADEYEQLKTDRDKLAALEAAGVDNWEGYDDAMQFFNSMK